MTRTLQMATERNITDIVSLRVEMQIEDWYKTLHKDFSAYTDEFSKITKEYLERNLNKSIFFAMMYFDCLPIAMCAVEEVVGLPQITVCMKQNARQGALASVYTRPQYRGQGYQQELLRYLLDFAKKENFSEITLTTNTPDAIHIYEKAGFERISDKFFMAL